LKKNDCDAGRNKRYEGCYKLKFLNNKNIINIGKYLILFFYVYNSQNDYYNNLYR
jgi:hypothetical protein